ncbi:MAG: PIN domain-containing protein [bacterium]
MNYILDTHILIWYFIGSKRLKKTIKDVIDTALNNGKKVLIPTIVLAEALDVAEKQKVVFDFKGMYQLIKNDDRFEIIGFSQVIFEEVMKLKTIPEIHDRIIVACAKFYSASIITKDKIIRNSDEINTL